MEIVKVNLENEMDLILAHKRSMKLAELCGFSNLAQTAFATAISEISRCAIASETTLPILILGINELKNKRKELVAQVNVPDDFEKKNSDAIKYAKRLSDSLKVIKSKDKTEVIFTLNINFSGLINDAKLDSFVEYFKRELPVSPYDEIRKKNIQLLDLAEKLKASEQEYSILTETVPLMMFTANAAGNILYANKWFKDFFKLGEIVPSKNSWQNFIHISDNRMVRNDWEKSFLAQSSFRTQARIQSKSNEEILWHLISLIPVKNENNQLTGWTGFFVDINAQKSIEETLRNNEELKHAQKLLLNSQSVLEQKIMELNKSNHDLEQFAYIASHDLQEPLRKIRNFSDLLNKNLDNVEKTKKYVGKIDQASERMLSLIRDVLNYSRLSKSENKFDSVDLSEILENVKLDMELLLNEKNGKIISSELPKINGISLQLYQLFYNLISNSLKFSEKKPEIKINCRKLSSAEVQQLFNTTHDEEHIELTFKDNGIGFDQKYATQIFTIFRRLNPKEAYSGTGIGLALCKKIVENHFGKISVTSGINQGTEFRIVLPVN